MANIEKLGFIGAGLMGHGMAKNLLKAGYPLMLMGHKNRAPIDDLLARGATEAQTPGEIAAAVDMLILCVTSSTVVQELVQGEHGILENGRAGLIVVDCSTGDPSVTLDIGRQLAERGMHLIDAPLARTPREAEEGRLNIMLGGDPAIRAQVRTVVQACCENIFDIGELGSALKLKLINNLLTLGHAALAAEAIMAARATGVDLAKLYEVASRGGANSTAFSTIVSRLLEGDETGMQFTLRNARKDLGCYHRMLDGTDMLGLLWAPIYDTFNLATLMGHGDKLVSQLAGLLDAQALGSHGPTP
ncbi:NAD(P)-dependent oxidoreductase [Castellaniella sp.]|uniref:NAD(P)-dependent oxidoreductase n=1 Tax=Castellaniella sp. TaxID=1955812 RepID=UPI00356389B5